MRIAFDLDLRNSCPFTVSQVVNGMEVPIATLPFDEADRLARDLEDESNEVRKSLGLPESKFYLYARGTQSRR